VKVHLKEKEAFEIEINLIKKYKEIGQAKCNLTEGGEGSSFPVESWNWYFTKLAYVYNVLGRACLLPNGEEYRTENLRTKTKEELKEMWEYYNAYFEYGKWYKENDVEKYNPKNNNLEITNKEISMLLDLISKNIAKEKEEFNEFLNDNFLMFSMFCDSEEFIKSILQNNDFYKNLVLAIMDDLIFLRNTTNRLLYEVEPPLIIHAYSIENNDVCVAVKESQKGVIKHLQIDLIDIIWEMLFNKGMQLYQVLHYKIFKMYDSENSLNT